LAQRIVAERRARGGFKSSSDLEAWLESQQDALQGLKTESPVVLPPELAQNLREFAVRAGLDAIRSNLSTNARRNYSNPSQPSALFVDKAGLLLTPPGMNGTGAALPVHTLEACFGPTGVFEMTA